MELKALGGDFESTLVTESTEPEIVMQMETISALLDGDHPAKERAWLQSELKKLNKIRQARVEFTNSGPEQR